MEHAQPRFLTVRETDDDGEEEEMEWEEIGEEEGPGEWAASAGT